MSILNFVTQDQLDELDEDPRVAFMQLANLAQRSLADQTKNFDPDHEQEWREIEDLRHSFVNVLLAAAKRFEIEPFASMELPTANNFDNRSYRDFRDHLDHYITQLVIDNSSRTRRQSVEVPPKTKDSIRGYIQELRGCIEQSDMPDTKREALLDRLDAFQAELEKRRVNLLAVSMLVFDIIAVPGAAWASYELTSRVVTNIMQTVAKARAEEQEKKQLAPPAEFKALSPPRRDLPSPRRQAAKNYNFDDDIPF
ncbi:hypothetical protein [Methylobacterium pseudosasicola]|nr:hypothetical protein [Methylobacterium pseudosasicola]